MVVYSFYIFDRHSKSLNSCIESHDMQYRICADTLPAECIYSRLWARQQDRPVSLTAPSRPISTSSSNSNPTNLAPVLTTDAGPARTRPARLSAQDDAKLIFGTIFSLRNMVRKLGGPDDSFISFRTGQYKLHYYETPTSIKFVMLTDTATLNMRNVLHQIYVNLYVEFGKFDLKDIPFTSYILIQY
jgi:hypothetical protein